jgi:hypothetical protein
LQQPWTCRFEGIQAVTTNGVMLGILYVGLGLRQSHVELLSCAWATASLMNRMPRSLVE